MSMKSAHVKKFIFRYSLIGLLVLSKSSQGFSPVQKLVFPNEKIILFDQEYESYLHALINFTQITQKKSTLLDSRVSLYFKNTTFVRPEDLTVGRSGTSSFNDIESGTLVQALGAVLQDLYYPSEKIEDCLTQARKKYFPELETKRHPGVGDLPNFFLRNLKQNLYSSDSQKLAFFFSKLKSQEKFVGLEISRSKDGGYWRGTYPLFEIEVSQDWLNDSKIPVSFWKKQLLMSMARAVERNRVAEAFPWMITYSKEVIQCY